MVELRRKLVRLYVFKDALGVKFKNLIKNQTKQDEPYGLLLVVFNFRTILNEVFNKI